MPTTRSMTRDRGVQVKEYVVGSQAVVEILEEILLWLPFEDLLKVQRVSSMWRNVISGSEKLQRKLFLLEADSLPLTDAQKALMGQDLSPSRPLDTFEEWHRRDPLQLRPALRPVPDVYSIPHINFGEDPHLVVYCLNSFWRFPPNFPSHIIEELGLRGLCVNWKSKTMFPRRTQEAVPFHHLNPFLERIAFGRMYNYNGEVLVKVDLSRRGALLQSTRRPETGIGSMYISQPPATQVTFKDSLGRRMCDFRDDNGITMHQLARRMRPRNPLSGCMVQWSVRAEAGK